MELDWFRTLRSGVVDGPTLVCFPHAGGNVLSAAGLTRALPDRFRVLVAATSEPKADPAKAQRQPFSALAASLAEDLTANLARPGSTGRVTFVGNSYGALLAFQTALELQSGADPRLGSEHLHLIVSGFRSPSLPPTDSPLHSLPLPALRKELIERLNLAPSELDLASLRDFEGALRADLESCDTYRLPIGAALRSPVDVLHLTEDASVSLAELSAWQDVTTMPISITAIDAPHFAWSAKPKHVAAIVVQLTEKLAS